MQLFESTTGNGTLENDGTANEGTCKMTALENYCTKVLPSKNKI